MAHGVFYYPYDEFGGSVVSSGFQNIGPTSSVGQEIILDSSSTSGMSIGLTQGFSLRNTSGSSGFFDIQAQFDLRPGNSKIGSEIVLCLKLYKNGISIEGSFTNNTFTAESNYVPLTLSTSYLIYLSNLDEISVRFDTRVERGVKPDLRIFNGKLIAKEI